MVSKTWQSAHLTLIAVVSVVMLTATTSMQAQEFEVLHSFDNPPQGPTGGLTVGSDGLYGVAGGGSFNYGTVFRFLPPSVEGTGSLSKVYSFPDTDYADNLGTPTFGVVYASDGSFYGIRQGGSWSGYTAIYRVTAAGQQSLVHSFKWPDDGANPEGPLVEFEGALYGTCRWGGQQVGYDYPGTVFRLDLNGDFNVLYDFPSGAGGRRPTGGLVVRPADQKLYGVTGGGGTWDVGTLYGIDPTTGVLATRHSFNPSTDGSGPVGELTVGPDGTLYGAAPYGDNAHTYCGSIFSFDPATVSGFKVLKTFPCAAGNTKRPAGGMVLLNGWLYGVTWGEEISQWAGLGAVYRLNVGSGQLEVLHEFPPAAGYQSTLVLAPDGFIYGQSRGHGSAGVDAGSVFRIEPVSGALTTLHEFGPSESPRQPFEMVEDASGALIFTSRQGGLANLGMVARLRDGGTVDGLHTFTDGAAYTWGTTAFLTRGSDNALYGIRSNGGEKGVGSIFTLQADGIYTQLVTFSADDSYPDYDHNPRGALIESTLRPGTFYGTASGGGLYGEVFEMDQSGNVTPLVRMGYYTGTPRGRLAQTAEGDLYGVIREYERFEGGYGSGRVFKVTATGAFAILHTFDWTNGYWPSAGPAEGPLRADGSRLLYGTTEECGSVSCTGTVYRISPTGEFALLHKFTGPDGVQPLAELTLAADGRLYGSTRRGGQFGYGTLFAVTFDDQVQTLHHFDHTTGAFPEAALHPGTDGNLYGAATEGGPGGGGVLFRYNLAPTATARGPYEVLEGSSVTLGAGGSDPQGGPLTFAWDLDGDGEYDDAVGATADYAATTPERDGDGAYDVAVQATDETGIATAATATVTVRNVSPVVSAGADVILEPAAMFTRAGSFADPGPDSWSATVDYGDGSGPGVLPLNGTSFALSHTYAAKGSFTVTVVVTDDDGAQGSDSFVVTVDPIEDLIDDIDDLLDDGTLNGGQANSLRGKLEKALEALAAGNVKRAVTMLEAFINEVEGFIRGGVLTRDEGDPLIAKAQAVIDSLS